MLDYLLSQGTIYLPIGLILWLFALDKEGGVAIPLYIMGLLAVVFGLYSMRKAWQQAKEQEKADKERFNKLIELIEGISFELRGGQE